MVFNTDPSFKIYTVPSFLMLYHVVTMIFNENEEPTSYKDQMRYGLWMDT